MNISNKDATIENLDEINHILRASKKHWDYNDKFIDRFIDKFQLTVEYLNNNRVNLLYVNTQIAGFYSFIINSDNVFELDYFFLHPDHIGKGLGKTMWQACCQSALAQDKNEFIIWSDPYAEHFYLHMGCIKIGSRPSPMSPNRCPSILKFTITR